MPPCPLLLTTLPGYLPPLASLSLRRQIEGSSGESVCFDRNYPRLTNTERAVLQKRLFQLASLIQKHFVEIFQNYVKLYLLKRSNWNMICFFSPRSRGSLQPPIQEGGSWCPGESGSPPLPHSRARGLANTHRPQLGLDFPYSLRLITLGQPLTTGARISRKSRQMPHPQAGWKEGGSLCLSRGHLALCVYVICMTKSFPAFLLAGSCHFILTVCLSLTVPHF